MNLGSASRLARIVLLAPMLGACVFSQVRRDRNLLDSYGVIQGRVTATDWTGVPLMVVAAQMPKSRDGTTIVVTPLGMLTEPGQFASRLPAGHYIVGVYEDSNRNATFDDGERGVLTPEFEVLEGDTIEDLELEVRAPIVRPVPPGYERLVKHRPVVGKVVPLDDPRFGEEYADLGMWQPLNYALKHEPGLYLLEPFDASKTPVVFVHGMTGYPQEFTALIGALDRSKFQPWVLLYPSGFALTIVAEFFDRAVDELEATYAIERMCVVGHSMGGLVARGFMHFHTADPDHKIRGLVTIASPLDGMPSAGMGVKMAPEVVPSWYDLAPSSPYLSLIYERPLPESVEYHLLFGYDKKGADDGTVPLPSQLRDEAQAEATVVRGYRATHVGILSSKSVAAQVNRALARCRGETELPPNAPRIIDDPTGLVD